MESCNLDQIWDVNLESLLEALETRALCNLTISSTYSLESLPMRMFVSL